MTFDLAQSRIIVTGGRGFLGGAVCRALGEAGCEHVYAAGRADHDLTTEAGANRLMRDAFPGHSPDLVIHLAARVGGIQANADRPGEFFRDNMAMSLNVIEACRRAGMGEERGKIVYVASTGCYPKLAPVPHREEDLWAGYPDPSIAPYAVAKRAAMTMLEAYREQFGLRSAYLLPINLYGPGDHFDDPAGHVIPALVRRFSEAQARWDKEAVCWGSGCPTREFLFVDDAAQAVLRAAERIDTPTPINAGTGQEVSIRQVTQMIAQLVGFQGLVRWDKTKPDGSARRTIDTAKARRLLEWEATTPLREGLQRTIAWYRARYPVAATAPV